MSALHADYYVRVKKGQLLAEIDPRTLKSQLLSGQASAAQVNARLQSSQADLINQQANLAQVKPGFLPESVELTGATFRGASIELVFWGRPSA